MNADAKRWSRGDERLTFAELDRISECVAHGLVARGIAKGDRVAHRHAQLPGWVVSYMAIVKAGGVATLLNGWWEAHELEHALRLSEPRLIIADAPRAKRIARNARRLRNARRCRSSSRVERGAGASCSTTATRTAGFPRSRPEDDATHPVHLRLDRRSQGRAVDPPRGDHRDLRLCDRADGPARPLTEEGRAPPSRRAPCSACRLFHVTGEVPVMLNSFVVGRCMVVMPKWDAGEALRLIEKERITYFVGVPTMSLELMNHPDRAQI